MAIAYLIASVPPVLLLIYIWYLDRLEHEPFGLVAKVLLASALLGTMAASLLEELGAVILSATPFGELAYIGDFLYFFLVVALVEELCKFLPVRLMVWKNPAFDHRFDAVVYCVASAIGFAVFENIMYVGVYGADIAIGRLIPVHTICGVFMGYFLSCAKMCELGGNIAERTKYMRKALLIPILIHGAWDFCVSVEVASLEWLALAGIIVLTIYAWRRVHLYAKYDAPF